MVLKYDNEQPIDSTSKLRHVDDRLRALNDY